MKKSSFLRCSIARIMVLKIDLSIVIYQARVLGKSFASIGLSFELTIMRRMYPFV